MENVEIHLIIPPIERVEIIDDKVVDGDEVIRCGNGLLTYILTSEGYDGIGIDLRKRKIWDLFISKGAKLHGFKYTFNNKKITNGKYKAYQEYIKEIIEQCGFTLEYDWLRIPSTKNYAMVGRKRIIKIGGDKKINDDDGEDDIDKSIQNLINSVGYISIRKNE
nr:2992_t:CDS:2 [Entrophospora candida]